MKLVSMNSKEYKNIHDWLRRHKKGNKCEHCGSTDKKLDNDLKSECNHERNLDNYIKLCRKCHVNYDKPNGVIHSEETKRKIGDAQKGKVLSDSHLKALKDSKVGISLTDNHKDLISKAMSGENHHNARLTKDQAIFILHSDLKSKDLAKQFNVTYETINNIKSRKTWKRID